MVRGVEKPKFWIFDVPVVLMVVVIFVLAFGFATTTPASATQHETNLFLPMP